MKSWLEKNKVGEHKGGMKADEAEIIRLHYLRDGRRL